jgi:xanthine dehydrogenase iron-sulfur cluster and FAD-binding subunit A
VVYIHEALHQPYRDLHKALPETLCKIIGFQPASHAEAVRSIIAFSQSRVVADLWYRRKKLKRALRAEKRGSWPAEEFYASLVLWHVLWDGLCLSAQAMSRSIFCSLLSRNA